MRTIVLVSILLFYSNIRAQQPPDTVKVRPGYNYKGIGWEALVGYSYQNGHYLDVGLGRNAYGVVRHPFFAALTIGSEFYLEDMKSNFIFAPKISARLSGGAAYGLSVLNYTNMKNNCFVIRPEIGVGLFWFYLGYGYNLKLSNTDFEVPARHVFFAVFHLFKNNAL